MGDLYVQEVGEDFVVFVLFWFQPLNVGSILVPAFDLWFHFGFVLVPCWFYFDSMLVPFWFQPQPLNFGSIFVPATATAPLPPLAVAVAVAVAGWGILPPWDRGRKTRFSIALGQQVKSFRDLGWKLKLSYYFFEI